MCRVMEYIIGVLLLVLAYNDWKTKRVSIYLLGIVLVMAVTGRIFCFSISAMNTIGGVGVGILLLGISWLSREAIGYGDSGLILSLGIGFGGMRTMEIVFRASCFACVFSIVYGIRHGWNKKHTLPYIPFVAAAYWGGIFL